MKICLLPCDIDGSGCYRLLFPGRELTKRGMEAKMPPYTIEQKKDGSRIVYFPMELLPDADIYVVQRRMEVAWVQLAKKLRAMGKIVISETDDYFLGTPSYNPALRGTSPYKRSFAVEMNEKGQQEIVAIKRERRTSRTMGGNVFVSSRDEMHRVFANSSAMVVSTPFLAETYSRFNKDITVIPNYLDWEMWERVTPQYEVERKKVRVGWMGKMKWRAGDLAVLYGLLGPWLERHPEVEFVAAGEPDEKTHDFLGIPKDQRVVYDEAPFLDVADITATFDIGLVPLEYNNFNEAKSHLKGMEYAACGIPCIATPTESYRNWVTDGENGFLARRPRDWLRHLETLVSDDALRRRMGRAARAKASDHTIQKRVGEWERYFTSVAPSTALTPATSPSSAPAPASAA